jgi:hypothetical protein
MFAERTMTINRVAKAKKCHLVAAEGRAMVSTPLREILR